MSMDAREIAERIVRETCDLDDPTDAITAIVLSYGDAIREEDATHIDELGAILFFGLDKDERVRIRTNIANGIRSLKSTPSPPAPVSETEQETERK